MKKKIILIIILLLSTFDVKALELDINSNNAILYNLNDNSVLYEKNSYDKTSIASLTKIMTSIVAIEHINNLDDKVTLTYEDFRGLAEANAAVAGFKIGEEVTYRDLLYGLLLPSGADAAQALTRNIAGSTEKYIELMNEKSKELKLKNTNFVNPVGLDDPNHYSTVEDVATVFKYALKNEEFKKIITSNSYTISDGSLTFRSTLTKGDSLSMNYLQGGKTGTTYDAGYCLASISTYNGVDYMLVTAKTVYPSSAPINFLDAKTIYEYFMNNYSYKKIEEPNDILVSLKTKYAKKDKVVFKSKKTVSKYLDNDFSKDKLKYKYTGVKVITTDMKKGTKLGKVDIYYNDKLLTTEKIILKEQQKFDIMKYLKSHKKQVIIVGGVIILIIVMFLMIKIRYRKGN